MPYVSARQRRFMHVRHPGIARRWDAEERVGKSSRESGLADLAATERVLVRREVVKARREARVGPSELDIAAAGVLLEMQLRKLGYSRSERKRIAQRELKAAIARGYLNAPYTAER